MSTHSHQFKHYRAAIAIAAVCLVATLVTLTADMDATAQSRRAKSKYGLGTLPGTARSGGGIRTPNQLTRITLLAPQDGGITLSERPTFYWYVAPIAGDKDYSTFPTGFRLRDPGDNIKAFEIKRSGTKVGLYSLTLPAITPAMEIGKDQAWVVQDFSNNFTSTSVVVRLKKNEVAIAELNKAKTNLEKARIYERYGYWYDALHAYTQWIEANPKDTIAQRERANMIEVGLKDNCDFRDLKDVTAKCDFREEGQINLKLLGELQRKIDGTAAVDLASFSPEITP
jgi:tetratricopeptide (TPR) repeat protein